MSDAASIFRVTVADDHGNPLHCSFCDRTAMQLVELPRQQTPVRLPGPEDHFIMVDSDPRRGVCAFCLLEMAKALQKAHAA